VCLVAADFGAWIAAEIAIRSTSRLSHLVLIGALGIRVAGREERDIVDLWATSREDLAEMMYVDQSFAETGESSLREDYSGLTDDELTAIARGRESLVIFGWQPYLHNPALRSWLHRIDVPTLVIWGEEDRFASPEYGQAFAHSIPGAQFKSLPGVAHYPYIERPEVCIGLIADFLQRNGATEELERVS
jgi:pimeloyl-ACP methyl ester carboxylesterase